MGVHDGTEGSLAAHPLSHYNFPNRGRAQEVIKFPALCSLASPAAIPARSAEHQIPEKKEIQKTTFLLLGGASFGICITNLSRQEESCRSLAQKGRLWSLLRDQTSAEVGTAVVFHPQTTSKSWRVSKARSSMLQQTEIHACTSTRRKKTHHN